MRRIIAYTKRHYGGHPLHLVTLLACFAFVGYVISVMGPKQLWNSRVWWQSILVWFLGAIALNDLLLFPFYALADRSLHAGWKVITGRLPDRRPLVPVVNYLRVPALASGLLFAMFLPGIIKQGSASYFRATGQTQAPFLDRWLLITAVLFGASAVAYAGRSARVGRRQRRAGETSELPSGVEPS